MSIFLPWRFTTQASTHLAVGLGLALLFGFLGGLPVLVLHALNTLVHEIGHAVAGWISGRPSLPQFDLQEGGGVTRIFDKATLLIVAWAVIWVFTLVKSRESRWWSMAWVACVMHGCLMFTSLDLPCITYAGHASELVFSAIFLIRSATGMAVVQQGEAWLYGILGWGLWLCSASLPWNILHDPEIRAWYLQGKSYSDCDFVVLSGHLHLSLSVICILHVLMAFLTLGFVIWFSGWWIARRLPDVRN